MDRNWHDKQKNTIALTFAEKNCPMQKTDPDNFLGKNLTGYMICIFELCIFEWTELNWKIRPNKMFQDLLFSKQGGFDFDNMDLQLLFGQKHPYRTTKIYLDIECRKPLTEANLRLLRKTLNSSKNQSFRYAWILPIDENTPRTINNDVMCRVEFSRPNFEKIMTDFNYDYEVFFQRFLILNLRFLAATIKECRKRKYLIEFLENNDLKKRNNSNSNFELIQEAEITQPIFGKKNCNCDIYDNPKEYELSIEAMMTVAEKKKMSLDLLLAAFNGPPPSFSSEEEFID